MSLVLNSTESSSDSIGAILFVGHKVMITLSLSFLANIWNYHISLSMKTELIARFIHLSLLSVLGFL